MLIAFDICIAQQNICIDEFEDKNTIVISEDEYSIKRRLSIPGRVCPDRMLAIFIWYEMKNVWGIVSAFIHLPKMFLSTYFPII